MLIQVKLLRYASKFFTYRVPVDLQKEIAQGKLIQVPLKNKIVPAVVDSIDLSGADYPFLIKSIIAVYPFPEDRTYPLFLQQVGEYAQTDPHYFLRRIQQFLSEKEYSNELITKTYATDFDQTELSAEQKLVCDQIIPVVQQQKYETFLLHGVTGSGKTEIYKNIIKVALAQGQSVMVMLPEVSLALQFESIFAAYFENIAVFSFHSATSVLQKKKLWNGLLLKQPMIIVGVHLPVLLPVANLGLIIVDEEHDAGYQEKKHPKLHSRDMAILKASMYKIPIVLGSATPSVQSLYNLFRLGWKKLSLTKRFSGNFPTIKLVCMKENKKRKNFWITDELFQAILSRLEKKEQTIIFLNRRGYSFFVQCTCGFIFSCHQCSVSLTLHADQSLNCHYCGHKEYVAKSCSDCGQSADQFLKKGIGTQQVVSILQKLFPSARIERADMDTTVKKRSWANTVQQMEAGEIDILVGTQSITKGYHFAGVTLVGVLWADLNLHFPVYNASEVCLQQLIQVAGRAGRQTAESLVIIQAFDMHPIFEFLNETEYLKFYDYEIEKRIEVGYPPYKHLAEIELKGNDQDRVLQEALLIKSLLEACLTKQQFQIQLLGPIQSMVYKVKSVYTQKIYLKSMSRNQMMYLFSQISQDDFFSSIYFTLDPVG